MKSNVRNMIAVSNALARSSGGASMPGLKVEALAVAKLVSGKGFIVEKKDDFGAVFHLNAVKIDVQEIADLMRCSGNGIYDVIKNAVFSLVKRAIIVYDQDTKLYYVASLYSKVTYNAGSIYIEFSIDAGKYFLGLKSRFTKYDLGVLFSFQTNGGFRLYRLLKSFAYAPALPGIDMSLRQEDLPYVTARLTTDELRANLGYMQDDIAGKMGDDGEDRATFMKLLADNNRKNVRWSDFKERIIRPGIEELNSLSDIYVSTEEEKGAHGKVESIVFKIQWNRSYFEREERCTGEDAAADEVLEARPEREEEFLDDMRELMSERLRTPDLRAIAKEAGYDMDRVRKAYAAAKSVKNGVDNLVGFMVMAIREDYSSKKQPAAPDNRNPASANFTQRHRSDDEWRSLQNKLTGIS